LKAGSICIVAILLSAAVKADTQAELVDKAEQLIRSGSRDEALAALAKAAEATPATAESEDRIGFLYAVLQQQSDAQTHFEKSFQANAGYAPAHFHLGVLLWNGGQQERGLNELQTAAKLDPNVFDYRYRLGSAYLRLDRFDDAVPELKQAVAINAGSAPAWTDLARSLQQRGDLPGAVDAFAKAVELDPSNDGVHNMYAYALIETRQAQKGIEESKKVLAHNPKDTSALMNIGYAELKTGDFDAAEKAYREMIAVDANSAAGHYDLGIALKSKDQIEAAQQEFREAIRLDPSLAQAHYSLGISDWQLGDFAGLAEEMRAAIKISPDYAEAHYMLGIALKESGDLDGALAELKESVKLDPSTPGPYNTMGQILRMKGEKQASEEAFATGARLKKEKESELANTLEQGMRGGEMMKPITQQPK
jgi:tetratricopeptide (TPR) repeat protein